MNQLSPQGQQVVSDLAGRYGFSEDAVTHMMFAVLHGNGSMAQFGHGEFGGSGQWMRGGMTMVGDMFNHNLKGRVDSLCSEIANILERQPGLLRSGSFQSQSQNGSDYQHQQNGGHYGSSSLFVTDPEAEWWPKELGQPSATGAQNNVRYAYFSGARRLAVKTGGDTWVYDTLDHQIGGFSQQQGMGGSITFSSQYGTVMLSSLPVVSQNGQPVSAPPSASFSYGAPNQSSPGSTPSSGEGANSSGADSHSILNALERLGQLREKGVLSDQEFASKKAELLSRL